MSEYIGNLIKIVDQKGDVYVGFLAKISAETSTVELTSVTLNPNSKNSQKLESIQLNGSDVQDLQVLDSTQKVSTDESTLFTLRCLMQNKIVVAFLLNLY